MVTFNELAQRLEPFADPLSDDEEDGGWDGVQNDIVLGFARSGLALWNTHVEKNTPGFSAPFHSPGALREYLERVSPDSFTNYSEECDTTAERATDWVEVFRLLAGWADEVAISTLAQRILLILDGAAGRPLCVAAREGYSLIKELERRFKHKYDPKVIRREVNNLIARGLAERSQGPRGGCLITTAGHDRFALLNTP